MHIEFLVEEPSAEAALLNLVPRIVGPGVSFVIHPHQGKSDLLARIEGRLRGYRYWLPADWRIVVLLDLDNSDCVRLEERLEQAAGDAGLITRTRAEGSRFQVLNRIAIEELEAWFFGDVKALSAAYPGVPKTLGEKAGFRDPDAIHGGTWEALERVLQKAGYYASGLPKIENARNVSSLMDPNRNASRSFRLFRDSLRQMVAQA